MRQRALEALDELDFCDPGLRADLIGTLRAVEALHTRLDREPKSPDQARRAGILRVT